MTKAKTPTEHDDADDVVEYDFSEALGFDDDVDDGLIPLSKEAYAALIKSNTMTMEELFNRPDPTWFIEGLVPAATLNVLHGPGGAKKTFLALDWMLSCAYNIQWQGHDIKPGSVLYIAAEGVGGLKKRVRAWMSAHDITDTTERFAIMPKALNLFALKDEQVGHWRELVEALEFDYVVFDTLHRCTAGAEENSSKELGLALEHAAAIAGEQAKVWFLHHDSRAGNRGGRGSTAVLDDTDVSLALTADDKWTSTLKSEKLKDAEDFDPLKLRFAVHGDGITSSLYIDSIGAAGIDLEDEDAADAMLPWRECARALNEYALDLSQGRGKLKEQLDARGHKWAEKTIDKAKKYLQGDDTE